ncbi:MAG: MBL fold metallo-hydrolase [Proteobacteria bacterium]|nr:MBL fold metallo-hydrolase [Pseudomonadota bacterium]
MLRFRSLASGSSGNATLVEARAGSGAPTRVLVDCGLGLRQLAARLAAAGLGLGDIDAIFITHEHGDHVGCALALSSRHRIPLWTSAGTWAAIADERFEPIVHLTADGQHVAIGALQVSPFTVPHDAREPLQLRCSDGARRLGILTDLGHVTPHALAQLAGCHALQMESNHDPALLAHSRYPDFLKRRIAGERGHLSNEQAAQALAQLAHAELRCVVAAHLSERNNRPEHARAGFAQALGCAPHEVQVATREGLDWMTV